MTGPAMNRIAIPSRRELLRELRHDLTAGVELVESPHYETVRGGDFYPTIFARGPFPRGEWPRIVAADYVRCAALCWPECDRDALWDFSAITLVFLERDDIVDTSDGREAREMVEAYLADAENDFTTTNEELYGPLMKLVWDRLRGYVPPAQLDRLTGKVREFFHGCLDTVEQRATGAAYGDLDAYLRVRRHTIGQAIDQVLLEISLGVDLTEELENPLLRRLNECDIDRVLFLQDLLSLHKEILLGEDTDNTVTVVARRQHLTTAEAAERTMELFRGAMDEHAQLSTQIIEEHRASDISRYARGLDQFVAGLLSWSTTSPRYAR